MSKPLLVQVIPTLGGGGAEIEVARVSPYLNEHGPFEVAVCCIMGRGNFADAAEKAGVEVVVLHEGKRFSPVMGWDLMRFLQKRKPLVVHSHMIHWGPTMAKLAGVPVVIQSEHNWALTRGKLGVLFDRFNTIFADGVIAVSEAVKDARIKKWKTPADRITVVPPAINAESVIVTVDKDAKRAELGIPPGVPVVGNIARLMPQKAQHLLVDAAAEVLKVCPECRFLILGDGPCREPLEQQCERLGISDRVHLLGFRNDVRQIIQIMDVSCLSSLTEGLPYVMLESMACGKPAVVTKVGGCPEVVQDGVTGLVVPPGDVSSLAQGILKLISDPELARIMGDAGMHRVRTEYSEEKNLERLLGLYTRLINEKGLKVD